MWRNVFEVQSRLVSKVYLTATSKLPGFSFKERGHPGYVAYQLLMDARFAWFFKVVW